MLMKFGQRPTHHEQTVSNKLQVIVIEICELSQLQKDFSTKHLQRNYYTVKILKLKVYFQNI